MDIDLLRTFLQVSQTRSFRKAADQLFLTQSAVSARIKQLEEQLGARLFDRNTHDVTPTTAGSRFLPHAEAMLADWNRARQAVKLPESTTDTLIIGATDTIWQIFLMQWLVETLQRPAAPAVRAELHTPKSLLPDLLDGFLDLAVMFERPALPRVAADELAEIPFVLVASAPQESAEEAMRNGFISVDWGATFETSLQRHFPQMPAGRLHTGIGKVALGVMLQQGGAAWLPEPMVRDYFDSGRLYLVADAPRITRPVFAISLPQSKRQPLIEQTMEQMGRCLQQVVQPG